MFTYNFEINFKNLFMLLKKRTDIVNWLKRYGIEDFTISKYNNSYSVDVHGSVDLSNCKLKYLPVQFSTISGDFDISNNCLTNLDNLPQYIKGVSNYDNNVYSKSNDIMKWLDKNNVCNYQLVQTKGYGYVVDVDGDVSLRNLNLKLIQVKFGVVKGNFDCSHCNLLSLQGAPSIVYKNFNCSQNKLTNFKNLYIPKVNGNLYLQGNYDLGHYQKISSYDEYLMSKEKEILNNTLVIKALEQKVHKI